MKVWTISAPILTVLLLMAGTAGAAGIMVTQEGLSDPAITVSVGEPISWIDVTGRAVRIAFSDVRGTPVLKEFVGREAHVFFDRPGRYRYSLTVGTDKGARELSGEITVR